MQTSIISKIVNAKASQRSENIRDGEYVFVVRKLILEEMQDGQTFVAELGVVESRSKGDLDPVSKSPVNPNAVGSVVGYVQKLTRFESAPANAQRFLTALLGGEDPKKLEAAITNLLSEEGQKKQAAKGLLIRGSTYQQQTKKGPNAGKINTYVNFFHVSDDAQGDVAARAKTI